MKIQFDGKVVVDDNGHLYVGEDVLLEQLQETLVNGQRVHVNVVANGGIVQHYGGLDQDIKHVETWGFSHLSPAFPHPANEWLIGDQSFRHVIEEEFSGMEITLFVMPITKDQEEEIKREHSR